MPNQEQMDSKKEENCSSEDVSRLIESQEINKSEHDIMKGDTIGDTLYSAKWILNTLVSLSKVFEDGWNESIEEDLCNLWDMSAEKDIVEFLLENDFYKLCHFVLKLSEESRLTEIIIGIIGNMCCREKGLKELVNAEDLVCCLMSFITAEDKETLIQVLRILQAAVWHIQKNPDSTWLRKIEECEMLGEAIIFILKSSTSDDLLTRTIDFVYLISETELSNKANFFECVFNIDRLIFSLCESMMELVNQTDNYHTDDQYKNIENWFNIILNIMKKNLLIFSDSENDENFLKINAVFVRILQPYSEYNNLILSIENSLLCIQQAVKMSFYFQNRKKSPSKELIHTFLKIMVNLEKATVENESKNCVHLKELYKYIAGFWVEVLKDLNADEIVTILHSCDLETVDSIIEATNTAPVSKKSMKELLQAKSKIFSV